jgi:multiple sugar transport system substrate-binding protein
VTKKMLLGRRTMLAGLTAPMGLGGSLRRVRAAVPKQLTVLAHPVLLAVCKGTAGGDITAAWRQRTGIDINWVTLETSPLHERLFREASLGTTTIDLAFVVNPLAVPRVMALFEPLNPLTQTHPIEDFDDIFPGLRNAMLFGGETRGIPFRHSTSCLHYNAAFFAERGVGAPPGTAEEFVEIAEKLSYRRTDGSEVAGFCISGATYANIIDVARMWNGDFIDQKLHVVANQKPMVQAITLLGDFYHRGVLPRSFVAVKDEDVNSWMTTGRAAITFNGSSRTQFYNDPAKSKFPGQFKVAPIPIAAALKAQFPVAPVKTEFWSMVIPRNSVHKELAWSLIVALSSKESTLKAALNGNGPVRASVYQDYRLLEMLPYARVEAEELRYARIPLPAFDQSARAADIFVEEMQGAVLGLKSPQAAMDAVVRQVQPLLH